MRKISKREPVWTGCVERSPRMGTCTVLQGSHSNKYSLFVCLFDTVALALHNKFFISKIVGVSKTFSGPSQAKYTETLPDSQNFLKKWSYLKP